MRNPHNSIYDILNDPRPSSVSRQGGRSARGAPDTSSRRRHEEPSYRDVGRK